MKLKYLYIEDSKGESYVDALKSGNKNLDFELEFPKPINEEIKKISSGKYDGLLMDLRLDETAGVVGVSESKRKRATYRAPTLAQDVRTRSRANKKLDLPIVLISSQEKVKRIISPSETDSDLFDMVLLKENVPNEKVEISSKLLALASGYRRISVLCTRRSPTFSELCDLGSSPEDSNLDPRLVDFFGSKSNRKSTYGYASFIVKQLLESPGPLIDENLLAARLGVDIENSPSWVSLKKQLSKISLYTGPFAEGWPRWWNHRLLKWWENEIDSKRPLMSLEASERIKLLKKMTGLKGLSPPDLIQGARGEKHWTLCQGLGRALDPIDGLIVEPNAKHPWQDRRYVSIFAAVERKNISNWISISSIESSRLKAFKKSKK